MNIKNLSQVSLNLIFKMSTCKKYFQSSVGLVKVVDDFKFIDDAAKYCNERNDLLIPLHNQSVVDEVSEKLENCDFEFMDLNCNCTHTQWQVGLDCKGGIYRWFDGELFNGSNYDPNIEMKNIESKECKQVLLDVSQKKLSFYKEKSMHPFLCSDINWPNKELSKEKRSHQLIFENIIFLYVLLAIILIIFILKTWYKTKQVMITNEDIVNH